jgi:multiple sugar transport system ATP-binding protein
VQTLHGIDLEIADGEFMVFVGPSGWAIHLLRSICGLEEISGGDLFIGKTRMNDVPPAKRGIAMVFQSYALYPHMSVAQNMAFGLKLAGMSKVQIADAVQRAAQILRIEPLLERKPKDLSGGQRQRGHRPRHRAQARRLPVRRTAVEPGRRCACRCASNWRICTANCARP